MSKQRELHNEQHKNQIKYYWRFWKGRFWGSNPCKWKLVFLTTQFLRNYDKWRHNF